MRLGARKNVEGKREKAVACKDSSGFVECLVCGWTAAPQIIVIHGGQIVVRQRIAMNALHRCPPVQLFLPQFIEYVALFFGQPCAIGERIGPAQRQSGGFARVTIIASIALAVWLYLLLGRGAFWRCSERDDWAAAELPAWPPVAAVVPARNEADCIGQSIASLLGQDYHGSWTVILVDDDSSDGTVEIAQRAVQSPERLKVVRSRGLPPGWTGKLWAIKQGIDVAAALPQPPAYVLLTDADIVQ